MAAKPLEMQEPRIDTDKLSYEIFSILESKFLFGYDDQKLWFPKQISPTIEPKPETQPLAQPNDAVDGGDSAIKNQRGNICILSIDGGGMREILSGKALVYLEHALKKKSGNPDARIADYFDIATGAASGKRFYRPGKCSNGGGFLRRILKGGAGISSTAGLEKAIKEVFSDNGQDLTLKDTLKPVLIPCYDLTSTAPFLFSRADALETASFDCWLWEACRATSAEPVQFEPVEMRSVDGQTCVAVDGGLAMNNPTGAAITHVLHNKHVFPFVRGVEGFYPWEQVNFQRLATTMSKSSTGRPRNGLDP
ncbi:Patatin [Quillaja saponaria]|uniref:Patatin n=1 Tax=Quillaja saponaria TaxID=32244 RepID=A0AAD7PWS3_QUISA|nr:Patatin [Quillaja saponaria]